MKRTSHTTAEDFGFIIRTAPPKDTIPFSHEDLHYREPHRGVCCVCDAVEEDIHYEVSYVNNRGATVSESVCNTCYTLAYHNLVQLAITR